MRDSAGTFSLKSLFLSDNFSEYLSDKIYGTTSSMPFLGDPFIILYFPCPLSSTFFALTNLLISLSSSLILSFSPSMLASYDKLIGLYAKLNGKIRTHLYYEFSLFPSFVDGP